MVTEVLRPETVDEAVRLGARQGSAFLGGGTWLNSGKAPEVDTLICLEKLALAEIKRDAGRLRIGAAATFQGVLDSLHVPGAIRRAVSFTASRTLRNMATIGGELGLLPPDSVLAPVLLALDAEVLIAGLPGPLSFKEFCRTRPTGLIMGISVPGSGRICSVDRLARTSHAPPSLVVAVSARGAAERLSEVRIVLSDCRGALEVAADLGQILSRFSPAADMHASAAYKSYMARVMAEDLLAALAEAGQ